VHKWIYYVIAAIILISCAYYQTNWQPIRPRNLPGAVAVVTTKYHKPYTPKCSGALIKPNAVLTAAHCIDEMGLKDIGVIYNCDYIYDYPNCIGSKAIGMAKTDWADLAIIVLEDDLSDSVQVVNISTTSPKEGQHIIIAGFGTDGRLAYGTAPVRALGVNIFATDYIMKIRPEPGDSGGPAYRIIDDKVELIGITSRYVELKEDGKSELTFIVHIDVSKHIEWIEEKYEFLNTLYIF